MAVNYLAEVTGSVAIFWAMPSPRDWTKLEYSLVPRGKEHTLKHSEQTVGENRQKDDNARKYTKAEHGKTPKHVESD